MTGPSLLTEMPGPRKAVLRRGGRTRCPPERARTAARRHLERPSSPPHNPACSSGSSRSSCGLGPGTDSASMSTVAEVVDGDLDTVLLQPGQNVPGPLPVGHQELLGDLQL